MRILYVLILFLASIVVCELQFRSQKDDGKKKFSSFNKREFELKRAQDDQLLTVCYQCPQGTYSNSLTTPSNCTHDCDDGWCASGHHCPPCPPGTFNDQLNATQCLPCPPDSVSAGGSSLCSQCPAGTQSNSVKSICILCPVGYFSPTAGAPCLPCGTGNFSSTDRTSCRPCPPGTFQPNSASGTCSMCGPGFYQPLTGQSSKHSCLKCPAAFFCPFPDNREAQPCPKNHYCEAGSSKAKKCPALFESPEESKKCTPQISFYVIISLVSGFVICFIGICGIYLVNRARREKKEKEDSARLIPKPKEGPIYTGL